MTRTTLNIDPKNYCAIAKKVKKRRDKPGIVVNIVESLHETFPKHRFFSI